MKEKTRVFLLKWFDRFDRYKITQLLSDKAYLKTRYKLKFNKRLNLKEPKTFNEKLQWLKLYNRKPIHTTLVDKVLVKDYIAKLIGKEYVIPTLGVWDNVEDIDFSTLPNQFVIKCNHNSGLGMYICKDKSKIDEKKVKEDLREGLRQDYYLLNREWPYKNVPRKIIAEAFLDDGTRASLNDYKVFNFNGEPLVIQVDFDRFTDHKKNLYTTNWEFCDFSFNYPSHPEIKIAKPQNLDDMLRISRILSKGEPFMRTDFYEINGKLYFGEITFFPASGYGKFHPNEQDEILGDLIELS